MYNHARKIREVILQELMGEILLHSMSCRFAGSALTYFHLYLDLIFTAPHVTAISNIQRKPAFKIWNSKNQKKYFIYVREFLSSKLNSK